MLLLLILLLFGFSAFATGGPPQVEADVAPASLAATPAATPGPGGCTVAPRTVGAVNEIVTAADRAQATPIGDETIPYQTPDGVPADVATIAAVDATVQHFVACINAGDFLRFLALFSDDALRRLAADFDFPIEADSPDLTPEPAGPDDLLAAVAEEVVILSDGRVSALVRAFSPTEHEADPIALHLTFVQAPAGDRWLIDELQPVTTEPQAAWTPVSGPGYEGVILSAADAVAFACFFNYCTDIQGWDPTSDQVAALEAALPAFLAAENDATPRMREELPTYLRQYLGIVDSAGNRLIVVNAFCDPAGSDWRAEPVFVFDGGDCFWNVSWNVLLAAFDDLMVNGEA